jgi:LPXTG-site transpeptidase (sortase) family protein
MSLRFKWAGCLGAFALFFSLLLAASENIALAQTAPAPAGGTRVAGGLMAPRYLVVADDGSIYVSEAGMGGDEKLTPPEGGRGADPNSPGPSRGYTGKITRISPNGSKTTVADKLPSYGPTSDAVGPAGLVLANGSLWLAVGGSFSDYKVDPLPNEGAVLKINPQTGVAQKVADLGAYERANNPNKDDVNSNLYGMTLGADGNLYVADAGGNCAYKVVPASGTLSVAACFGTLPAPPPPPGAPTPGPNDPPAPTTIQPVPTGVVAGKDGSIYVGFLALEGLGANVAKVVKIAPDGTVSDAAAGFNAITSLAAGPDGNLYVTELTVGFDPQTGPKPGQVTRVLPNGTKQVVASGLVAPNGVDFDKAGNMYVVTGTGFLPEGQIYRFNNVATPAAPAPSPSPTPTPPPPPGLPNTGMALTDDGGWTSTVRPEVSDLEMFGKKLSSQQIAPHLALSQLQPGSGPVVPARLRIPALNIDTNVESVGLHNGNMDVPNNIWNAAWLNSSVRPGDAGTAVIDGHKDSVKGAAIFWSLGQLKAGDRIYVSDQYGWELTFEVSEVAAYDLASAPVDRIFNSGDGAFLNLITCDGNFVRDQHSYDKRLVVYTRLVTNQ